VTRSDRRSTACTELVEQEVLDKIRQRRLEADLRRAAAGADRPDGVGPEQRSMSAAASARAVGAATSAALVARLRALVGRSAGPGSPIDR
jgi:hypothetical protein